ncbi:MAG: fibronectin type III domain-containing protein [Haliscomenobacter sp.]|nr:fibronectin type III domain-containing protein [Haliscomenobacter sp.]
MEDGTLQGDWNITLIGVGGYADGWYDPGKPGYPFSRYRFKPRLALLTPKAPAVTNISASLDEKDQIRLSWDAPLRDNRLLYQIYRQKRGAPSSLRLMSGWNSRIFFLDMEVEPGTYYEYFVFAAFNGSEATNSPAATATGKAFSEACPSFFRIADQTEDLTLLEWDLRDAYDYQVVKTDPVSGDAVPLSLWIPGPYFLEETLEGGQKHLLQLYARHRNTGKVFPCDQMILLDKTGSLPSISLQASKGQYAGRIEISRNSAPGYLYQLGKWQNARWEMLTAPGEDTLFVDEAGGIPNGDTIWYALFLLKDSLSTPQRAGEDFGFASGNIPAPVIQDVLLSLEEPFIQLFWDEPGLQVRVFRGSPDRPDALYPISDWLEGESDYTDLNVRKGGEYLYAIRTRQESRISDWSPFSLVNVPGDFSSLCDGAVSLECGFRGVFGSGENHVANLPGINAALGNKDLVYSSLEWWFIEADMRSVSLHPQMHLRPMPSGIAPEKKILPYSRSGRARIYFCQKSPGNLSTCYWNLPVQNSILDLILKSMSM